MNIPLCSALISLVFFGKIVQAQQREKEVNPEIRLHRVISILASDSLLGREAGTSGEKMAAAYISAQMRQIGLLPKGDADSSFVERFKMNDLSVTTDAKLQINGFDFIYRKEFGVTDLSASGNVSASIINIGTGKKGSTQQSVDSLSKDLFSGKIVLMDIISNTKQNGNDEILNEIVSRVNYAVQMGAAGIILHNSSRKSLENLLFDSQLTKPTTVPVIFIDQFIYDKINKLKTANCILTVDLNSTMSQSENIIGWIDNKSTRTVVIGAHYDHVGTGNNNSPQIHNGADDNASGTAAMLELARWAAHSNSVKYNYIFVAFSAEEKGLLGSKAFCNQAWVSNKNVEYMINLDMVGRLGCQGDTLSVLGIASSTAWNKVFDSLAHPDFAVKKIEVAPAFSDHSPFLKKGIPVVFFTTGLHPQYHTPQDDTELINFKGMDEILKYIRQFIVSAEGLSEILFHKISPFQNIRAYKQTFE